MLMHHINRSIYIQLYTCVYSKNTTPVIRSSLTAFLETSVFLSIPDHLCNSWYVRCAEKPFQTLSFSHDSQTCRDPMVFSFTTHSFAARVISPFLASQSWRELNKLPYLPYLLNPIATCGFSSLLMIFKSSFPCLRTSPYHHPGKKIHRAPNLPWQLLPFAQHGRHPQPLC